MIIMRKYLLILLLTAPLLTLAGCRPEIDFVEGSLRPGPAEVNLSGGNLSMNFSSGAGSASVDLKASGKWTAAFVNDRAKEWCYLSSESGKRGTVTITVSVAENKEYDDRSASVNFVCGDLKRTIVVTQKQKDALLLTSTRQDVGKEGGRMTVEVKANVSFNYEIAEQAKSWIKPVGTKGLSTSTLTFDVAANDSFSKREGEITFTSTAGTEVVKVYQECDTPTIIVSSDHYELPAESGQFSVEVRSNVDVSFEVPSACDWIHETTTKSMSTNTFHFSVDENEAFTDRTAKIVFRCAEWKLEEAVTVTQKAATPVLIIGSGEYEFEQEGGSLAIEVTSNFGITVSVPDSCGWIKPVSTKALTTRTFLFEVDINEAFVAREGVIVFKNEDLCREEHVTVRQKAEDPTLILGESQYGFGPEGGPLSVQVSSNLTLDVIIEPGCDWIVPVDTKAITERIHSFSVARNHGRHDRNAWIVFKNEEQNRIDTVHISQSFQPIVVSCDTLKASGRGWTVAFETASPTPDDYRLTVADRWISLAGQDRSAEGSRFSLSVDALKKNEKARDARILVYYKDFSEPDTVCVHQYERFPAFSYTTTARNITVPAIEGENQIGFVDWGDETRELWQEGLTYTYKTSGVHTVTIEIRSKKRVQITGLEDGMTINLRELRK